jgi:PPOX class probable FMN-dependent enzyme
MPDSMMAKPGPVLLDAKAAQALVDSYPKPGPGAVAKDIGRIDEHMRKFIEKSPFCTLATSSAEGRLDVTPRGDPPGSFKVLDEKTIAIADRPGNNRVDNLKNLLSNPRAGLLFMLPGMDETVRVNGRASISVDPDLLASMAVEGKQPRCAIVVQVEEAFLHCAKAFRRSRLWSEDYRVSRQEFPSLACMIGDQLKLPKEQVAQSEERIERAYRESLWEPMR